MMGRRRPPDDDVARAAHVTEVRTLVNLAETYDGVELHPHALTAVELLETWLGRLRIEVPEQYVRRSQPARQYAGDLLAIARAIRRIDEDPRLGLRAAGYPIPTSSPSSVARAARNALLDLDVTLTELAADSHHRTAHAARLRHLGPRLDTPPMGT